MLASPLKWLDIVTSVCRFSYSEAFRYGLISGIWVAGSLSKSYLFKRQAWSGKCWIWKKGEKKEKSYGHTHMTMLSEQLDSANTYGSLVSGSAVSCNTYIILIRGRFKPVFSGNWIKHLMVSFISFSPEDIYVGVWLSKESLPSHLGFSALRPWSQDKILMQWKGEIFPRWEMEIC